MSFKIEFLISLDVSVSMQCHCRNSVALSCQRKQKKSGWKALFHLPLHKLLCYHCIAQSMCSTYRPGTAGAEIGAKDFVLVSESTNLPSLWFRASRCGWLELAGGCYRIGPQCNAAGVELRPCRYA